MISYLIVGSGYRGEFFARIAGKHPSLFRALMLCRTAEKAAAVSARTGIPATASREEALAFRPDFAVVAVDRGHVADVTAEWARRGLPVLAETPVGASMEQLRRIWDLHRSTSAKISCCEQYHRYPLLAAGLAEVARGRIGTPLSLYLSLAHEYHGFSLIRRLLGIGNELYTLRALRAVHPVTATDSRCGAILDGSTAEEARDTAYLAFASGKTAVYDFSPLQYRSFIRSRHLVLRGDRGEWNDRMMTFVNAQNEPERLFLLPELPVSYRMLDTQALRDLRKTWTPELFLDTEQDEFAAASLLLDMGAWLRGGPAPYPLTEALDDAYFWLLLQEAAQRPGEPLSAPRLPWHSEG